MKPKNTKAAPVPLFSDDGTKYRGPYQAACGCVWSGNGSSVAPYQVKRCPPHAAAKDLLAALKAVTAEYAARADGQGWDSIPNALAAIAKATGGR